MTGSPVFKVKLSSNRKQIIQRLKISLNTNNDQSKNTEANEQSKEIKISDSQNDRKPSQSICSNSSSFVFPSKRGVKRKLNFDADNMSDDVNSLRFSGKNISLYGFRSKNSSFTDNKSLPDFNITFSPNKRRSFSRSSVTSSCRRRLFSDEGPSKNDKQRSPILCSKLNPKSNEIKLSLKKKFPGVPNSDSARSGLLLNLAFSKYNLSNNKQEPLSVDFVDNEPVNTATKKDFVHYSQIKKDESSLCCSPVFMAIKKVKRKLNLEDHDTISHIINQSFDDSGKVNATLPSENAANISIGLDNTTKKNEISNMNIDVVNEPAKVINLDKNSTHSSPSNHRQIYNSSPLFSVKKSNRKNDFFNNSKLRLNLRNKIFDLYKASNINANPQSPVLDSKKRSFNLKSKNSMNINAKKLLVTPKDKVRRGNKIKRLNLSYEEKFTTPQKHTNNDKKSKKWINYELFCKKEQQENLKSVTQQNQFLKSHMNRFLQDCLVAVEKRSRSSDIKKSEEMLEFNENNNDSKTSTTRHIENINSGIKNSVIENIDSEVEDLIIENVNSQRTDLIIENVDSQKNDLIIENSDSQPVDNVENVSVREEQPVIEDQETDESQLFSASINCNIFVTIKDVLGRKMKKIDRNVGTENHSSVQIEQESVVCSQDENVPASREILFGSVPDTQLPVNDSKNEQVSTSASYSCIQFTNPKLNSAPAKTESQNNELLETARKSKRKKYSTNTLMYRLDKVLSREKSDFRMWDYEVSKAKTLIDVNSKPAVFCIEKMWKEYSYLILLCSFHQQDIPESFYEKDDILPFADNISNSVIIIMEQEYCPKDLTYSSVFQIHPPWKLMIFSKYDPIVMLKPRKISLISKNGNPILYKDPALPKMSVIVNENVLCECDSIACDCVLPNSYQCLIRPLMFSKHNQFSSENFVSLNNYDADSFNDGRIDDVVIKHKLFSSQFLSLNLQVLHLHRNNACDEFAFWHVVCVDEMKNTCCVVVEGDVDILLSYVNENVTFRFNGILPWKLIPQKNIAFFLQYLNFSIVSNEFAEKIILQNMAVFILSTKHGNVERL